MEPYNGWGYCIVCRRYVDGRANVESTDRESLSEDCQFPMENEEGHILCNGCASREGY